jgi:hypothetical protein
MTNLPLALAIAAVGLMLGWLLFREVRSGTILSRNTSVRRNDDPMVFGAVLLMHLAVLALCVAGAVAALGLAR